MPKPIHQLAQLSEEEQRKLAFEKTLRYVTAREISTVKLKDKLLMYGFDEQVVSHTVNRAKEYGFVDDIRYSDCLIRSTLSQGKGLEKVIREINTLDVDIYSLDSYCEYIECGDNRPLEDAVEYLNNHPVKSKNLRDGAFRKLVNKGFSMSVASKASGIWVAGQNTNEDYV